MGCQIRRRMSVVLRQKLSDHWKDLLPLVVNIINGIHRKKLGWMTSGQITSREDDAIVDYAAGRSSLTFTN